MASLGKFIRQKRQSKNLTLQQLASEVGADAGNLSRIERGELGVSETLLRKIAAALETTPASLYALSEEENTFPMRVEEQRQSYSSDLSIDF